MLSTILNGVSAITAFFAAAYWLRASIVSVSPEDTPPGVAVFSVEDKNGKVSNPFATALKSSRLNARAAMFAAFAALSQGAALPLTMFCR
jgi:hypothetical protein